MQERLLQAMAHNFFKQLRIRPGSKLHFSDCIPSHSPALSLCLSLSPEPLPFLPEPPQSIFSDPAYLPASPVPDAFPSGHNEAHHMAYNASSSVVAISAHSVWGLLRALQSLAQLVIHDAAPHPHPLSLGASADHKALRIPDLPRPFSLAGLPFSVSDRPALPYRSVLIDLPRNYYPLEVLRRHIDFIAACKLNVLHLRIADDQGFMLEIADFPTLAKPPSHSGPLSRVYTVAEMKALVAHALARGVRVVPEIDLPTHAGSWGLEAPDEGPPEPEIQRRSVGKIGWKAGMGPAVEKEPNRDILLQCPRYACGTAWAMALDAFQNRTYDVIASVLRVLADVFPDPFLHLGGDEIAGGCFQEAGVHLGRYLAEFEERLFEMTRRMLPEKKIVRWQEVLASYPMAWDAVQVWTGAAIPNVAYKGKPGHTMAFVLSHGWYVDYAKQCLTAEECYSANTAPSYDLTRWLGVELSLWEMTPQRTVEADVQSQIVGFSGAAWRLADRPRYEAGQARRFCGYLEEGQLIDPEFQCHLHDNVTAFKYHEAWRPEFMQREKERDALICKRYNAKGACATKNCRRR